MSEREMSQSRAGHQHDRADDWHRIEAEAREQNRATLVAADGVPLVHGSVVAWSECRNGKTNDLSLVHRVGELVGDTNLTLCGEIIPAPLLRLPLSAPFIRVLGRCRYCEEAYVKHGVAA